MVSFSWTSNISRYRFITLFQKLVLFLPLSCPATYAGWNVYVHNDSSQQENVRKSLFSLRSQCPRGSRRRGHGGAVSSIFPDENIGCDRALFRAIPFGGPSSGVSPSTRTPLWTRQAPWPPYGPLAAPIGPHGKHHVSSRFISSLRVCLTPFSKHKVATSFVSVACLVHGGLFWRRSSLSFLLVHTQLFSKRPSFPFQCGPSRRFRPPTFPARWTLETHPVCVSIKDAFNLDFNSCHCCRCCCCNEAIAYWCTRSQQSWGATVTVPWTIWGPWDEHWYYYYFCSYHNYE